MTKLNKHARTVEAASHQHARKLAHLIVAVAKLRADDPRLEALSEFLAGLQQCEDAIDTAITFFAAPPRAAALAPLAHCHSAPGADVGRGEDEQASEAGQRHDDGDGDQGDEVGEHRGKAGEQGQEQERQGERPCNAGSLADKQGVNVATAGAAVETHTVIFAHGSW